MDQIDIDKFYYTSNGRQVMLLARTVNEIISHLQGQGESNTQPAQDLHHEQENSLVVNNRDCGRLEIFYNDSKTIIAKCSCGADAALILPDSDKCNGS